VDRARPTLTVVIPCFNEAATLETIVARAIDSPVRLQKEIIVVDDGSTDESTAIVDRLPQKYRDRPDASIIIERHPANRGKGAAVRTALARATGDIIIIQDADLEYDPQDYPALIDPILQGSSDVVYGTRRESRHLSLHEPRHWHFIAAARIVTSIANVLFGARLTDYATGYKAFTRRAAERLALRTSGFEVCAEMTGRFLKLGYPIVEIPIRYQPRTVAEGKKIRTADGWKAIWTLVRERWTG
jgi:glycosyltransferase involved in cell wall biosynthesis